MIGHLGVRHLANVRAVYTLYFTWISFKNSDLNLVFQPKQLNKVEQQTRRRSRDVSIFSPIDQVSKWSQLSQSIASAALPPS